MNTITKEDLLFNDYSWSSYGRDDPRLTGNPDAALLNRKEGYEVLHFINSFCRRHTWNPSPATKASAQKAERLIRYHLPGVIRARKAIDDWLVQNWAQYQ